MPVTEYTEWKPDPDPAAAMMQEDSESTGPLHSHSPTGQASQGHVAAGVRRMAKLELTGQLIFFALLIGALFYMLPYIDKFYKRIMRQLVGLTDDGHIKFTPLYSDIPSRDVRSWDVKFSEKTNATVLFRPPTNGKTYMDVVDKRTRKWYSYEASNNPSISPTSDKWEYPPSDPDADFWTLPRPRPPGGPSTLPPSPFPRLRSSTENNDNRTNRYHGTNTNIDRRNNMTPGPYDWLKTTIHSDDELQRRKK